VTPPALERARRATRLCNRFEPLFHYIPSAAAAAGSSVPGPADPALAHGAAAKLRRLFDEYIGADFRRSFLVDRKVLDEGISHGTWSAF